MPHAKKPLTPTPAPSSGTPKRDARHGAPGVHALPVGTRLRDYDITEVLSEACFGILYLAFDHSLLRQVAVKEYMPVSMATRAAGTLHVGVRSDQSAATYRAGLKSFLNEARLLARFDHPSLVKVYRFWEENGTAYMVMPYYPGPDLKTALAELGHVPTEAELRNWLRPILDAVTVMHEAGFYHHHIGTDNIRLTELGPVLLDFAAARRVIESETQTLAMSLKPGFAAIEQYGDGGPGTQGAWTDLYALGAVLYSAITGAAPMPAPERLARDGVLKLRDAAATLYSDSFLQAIDAALALQPEARLRDHTQFRAMMRDIDAPSEKVALSALRDLMLEPFEASLTRAHFESTPSKDSLLERAAPRRSRPGALDDAPATTSPGALNDTGRSSRAGALSAAGRSSRPGALNDAASDTRPGALNDSGRSSRPGALSSSGRNSRPGELRAASANSRPGALDQTTASTRPGSLSGRPTSRPGALDSRPSGLHGFASSAPMANAGSSTKALSPRAARIAAAHELSGEPSDLHPDVDFSGSLEPTPFFDRFGLVAKAGIAVMALALIGLAVWLAKPDLAADQTNTPVIATSPRGAPAESASVTTPRSGAASPKAPEPSPAPLARVTRSTTTNGSSARPSPAAATNGLAPVIEAPVTEAPIATAPLSEAARQARCVEILQKVSLEPMTQADATFYRRECKR